MISTPTEGDDKSTSISLSFKSPSRSFLRIFCRVDASLSEIIPASGDGKRMSRTCSSAASAARFCTFSIALMRFIFTAVSTRSRIIESTSRPT